MFGFQLGRMLLNSRRSWLDSLDAVWQSVILGIETIIQLGIGGDLVLSTTDFLLRNVFLLMHL